MPPAGEPAMPFQLPPRALHYWKLLVPILLGMERLTIADGDALGGYCTVLAKAEEAGDLIKKHGTILRDGTPNPAVEIQSDAMRDMRAYETMFGLTPSSRPRLGVAPDDDDGSDDDDGHQEVLH
jgi:P27 family predicted phage terminase small subunit